MFRNWSSWRLFAIRQKNPHNTAKGRTKASVPCTQCASITALKHNNRHYLLVRTGQPKFMNSRPTLPPQLAPAIGLKFSRRRMRQMWPAVAISSACVLYKSEEKTNGQPNGFVHETTMFGRWEHNRAENLCI